MMQQSGSSSPSNASAVTSRRHLRVGDIFSIPLDERQTGYGQIVWRSGHGDYGFAVFEGIYPQEADPALDAIVSQKLVLIGISMDALLYHGYWKVVGHRDVDEAGFPFPAYRAGTPSGAVEVVDFTATHRRPASKREALELPPRKVVAPIRFEKALRALHGLEPWDSVYDELRAAPEHRTSAALLPDATVSSADADMPASEQVVVTYLPLSEGDYGSEGDREAVHELERCMKAAVAAVGGEHDGHEFGGGEVVLYTFGPDAHQLLAEIQRCLKGFPVRAGAYATKRYVSADGSSEEEVRVPLDDLIQAPRSNR